MARAPESLLLCKGHSQLTVSAVDWPAIALQLKPQLTNPARASAGCSLGMGSGGCGSPKLLVLTPPPAPGLDEKLIPSLDQRLGYGEERHKPSPAQPQDLSRCTRPTPRPVCRSSQPSTLLGPPRLSGQDSPQLGRGNHLPHATEQSADA